jgi:predicted nucleic acid-binding protein
MIVVDTSAWVELLRKTESRTHRTLRGLIQEKPSELAITETVARSLRVPVPIFQEYEPWMSLDPDLTWDGCSNVRDLGGFAIRVGRA